MHNAWEWIPAAAAVIYSVLLIRREPFHLGLMIPATAAAAMVAAQFAPLRTAAQTLLVLILAAGILTGCALAIGCRTGKSEKSPQWILVPGYALHKGRMTKTLQMRLDRAEMLARLHPQCRILLSGGAPRGGPTEAAVMKEYLMQRGIHPDRILTEDESASSWQNMAACKALWDAAGQPETLLVTSGFHMLRMRWTAKAAGLRVTPHAAPSPLFSLPAEAAREAILLLKNALFGFASMAWANGKL